VSLRIDLRLMGEGDPIRYAGSLEIDGRSVALEVVVETATDSPDGLRAAATAPDAPAELRAELERLAGAMARAAARGARKDGLPPPRRIRRWRELRGT
jgi:hypothetical protein